MHQLAGRGTLWDVRRANPNCEGSMFAMKNAVATFGSGITWGLPRAHRVRYQPLGLCWGGISA